MRNKIFFHLVDIGNYREVVDDIFTQIYSSQLIDNSELFLYCNYDEDSFDWLKNKHKNTNLFFPKNIKENFELPTLIELKKYSEDVDCNILYLHCKGVTQPSNYCVKDWRDLMIYFNINRWKECVQKLDEGYDAVGVNWQEEPQKHFSGNFWWARSDYIKSLPSISLSSDIQYRSQFNAAYEYRQDAEFWIGQNNPKVYSMHQTNVNHYHFQYPKQNYVELE